MEKKFKFSLLAASVLMGAGLATSAMAAGTADTKAETTAAPAAPAIVYSGYGALDSSTAAAINKAEQVTFKSKFSDLDKTSKTSLYNTLTEKETELTKANEALGKLTAEADKAKYTAWQDLDAIGEDTLKRNVGDLRAVDSLRERELTTMKTDLYGGNIKFTLTNNATDTATAAETDGAAVTATIDGAGGTTGDLSVFYKPFTITSGTKSLAELVAEAGTNPPKLLNYEAKLDAFADAAQELISAAATNAKNAKDATKLTGDVLTNYTAADTNLKSIGYIYALQVGLQRANNTVDVLNVNNQSTIDSFIGKVKTKVGTTKGKDATAGGTGIEQLASAFEGYNTAKTELGKADGNTPANRKAVADKLAALIASVGTNATEISTAKISEVSASLGVATTRAVVNSDRIEKLAAALPTTDTAVKAVSDALKTGGTAKDKSDATLTEVLLQKYIGDLITAGRLDTTEGAQKKIDNALNGDKSAGKPGWIKANAEFTAAKAALADSRQKMLLTQTDFDAARSKLDSALKNLHDYTSGMDVAEIKAYVKAKEGVKDANDAIQGAKDALTGAVFAVESKPGSDTKSYYISGTGSALDGYLTQYYGTAYGVADIKPSDAVVKTAFDTLVANTKGLVFGGKTGTEKEDHVAFPLAEITKMHLESALTDPANDLATIKANIVKATTKAQEAAVAYDAAVAAYNAARAEISAAGGIEKATPAQQVKLIQARDNLLLAAAVAYNQPTTGVLGESVTGTDYTASKITVAEPLADADVAKLRDDKGKPFAPKVLTTLNVNNSVPGSLVKSGSIHTATLKSAAELNATAEPYSDKPDQSLLAERNLLKAEKGYGDAVERIGVARSMTVQSLKLMSDILPFAGAGDDVAGLQTSYSNLLNLKDPSLAAGNPDPNIFTRELATLAAQTDVTETGIAAAQAAGFGTNHTLYIGGLSQGTNGLHSLDQNGDWAKVLVKTGAVLNSFTEKDIFTGSQSRPFNTTVLNLEAPVLNPTANSKLSDVNLLSVGGSAGTIMEVNTHAYDRDLTALKDAAGFLGANNPLLNLPAEDRGDQSGVAVVLGGILRTGVINGIDGKPIGGVAARGADKILLHDINIKNTLNPSDLNDYKIRETKDQYGNVIRREIVKDPEGNPVLRQSGEIVGLGIGTSTVNQQINVNKLDGDIINATDGLLASVAVNRHDAKAEGYTPVATGDALKTEANIELRNINISVVNNTAGKLIDPSAGSSNPANRQWYHEVWAGPYTGGGNLADFGKATALLVGGDNNHIIISGKNNVLSARTLGDPLLTNNATNAYALVLSGSNNTLDISNTTITGNIVEERPVTKETLLTPNVLNLVNSTVGSDEIPTHIHSKNTAVAFGQQAGNTLRITLKNSQFTGYTSSSPDLQLLGGSTFHMMRQSSVNTLGLAGENTLDLVHHEGIARVGNSMPGSNVANKLIVERDITAAPGSVTVLNAGVWNPQAPVRVSNYGLPSDYNFGGLYAYGNLHSADATKPAQIAIHLQSSGSEPNTVNGMLASVNTAYNLLNPHAFVSYLKDLGPDAKTGKIVDISNVNFSGTAELGAFQYHAVKLDDPANPAQRADVFFRKGGLSNTGATVAALAAAPASVAAMEGNALGKHVTSLRHSEGSGVWISYYGGSNQNSLDAGPQYKVKTNGVMLGVDTSFADWMAGIAFTSGKSSLSVLNSSGNVNNYGAQFWLSRHYSNGVFVDGVAQFGHYANKAKVSMIDGTPARGEYASNGYGLSAKVGYAWQQASGFYAEPYVQATARAFSGAAYNLSNGMNVNSTDYKSFVGEIGTDLGYTVPTGAGYFKPYLHLAVLDEFANGNSVRANNIDLQNSINGAAFRIGVGGELLIMKNLGGYLSYDYTKGSNIERPWQVNLGVNYTW